MQSLQTGGNTQLDGGAISVAIEWLLAGSARLDASAYLLGASGKVRTDADMVFYNQPSGAGGAVKVAGNSSTDLRFDVDLAAIPDDIDKVVFCVTVDTSAGGSTLARHDGLKLTISQGGD
ncbi:MAG: TerD family protein, partial [Novosphingobium sp.]|nr:TerD family protein [Novosphingobium sp.]